MPRTRKLGEGAQGIAYNLKNTSKEESFLKSLPDATMIRSIILHVYNPPDHSTVTLSGSKIQSFLDVLTEKEHIIVKVLKKIGVEADHVLEQEVESNRTILNIYGEKAEEFLTIAPITGFELYKVMAAVFHMTDGTMKHAIFGIKCNNHYSMNLPKLIKDILDSLLILESKQYEHNDIKLDNLVLCSNRYKLIDWGESSPLLPVTTDLSALSKLHMGSPTSSSPIRWYCKNGTYSKGLIESIAMMGWRVYMKHPEYHDSGLFQTQYLRIQREYAAIIAVLPDQRMLYQQFRTTFGLFQLGMTILHAVYEYKLFEIDYYVRIVEYLTSLLRPVRSVQAAIDYIHSLPTPARGAGRAGGRRPSTRSNRKSSRKLRKRA